MRIVSATPSAAYFCDGRMDLCWQLHNRVDRQSVLYKLPIALAEVRRACDA